MLLFYEVNPCVFVKHRVWYRTGIWVHVIIIATAEIWVGSVGTLRKEKKSMLLSDDPQPFRLYLRKLSLEKLTGFVQGHKKSEQEKLRLSPGECYIYSRAKSCLKGGTSIPTWF